MVRARVQVGSSGTQAVVEQARAAIKSEGYSAALRILEGAERQSLLSPAVLVLMGVCIQMDEVGRRDVEDAERCFKEALEVDPDCVEALTELGWLYENVFDDPARAEPYFRRAIEVCQYGATEALLGLSKALRELNRVEEADALLTNPASVVVDLSKLEEKASRS